MSFPGKLHDIFLITRLQSVQYSYQCNVLVHIYENSDAHTRNNMVPVNIIYMVRNTFVTNFEIITNLFTTKHKSATSSTPLSRYVIFSAYLCKISITFLSVFQFQLG